MNTQKLLWIPEGKDIGAFARKCEVVYSGDRPKKVWTLFNANDENVVPTIPIKPVHNHNAFFEGEIHDWNIRNGVFRYSSRVCEGKVWLLLEF